MTKNDECIYRGKMLECYARKCNCCGWNTSEIAYRKLLILYNGLQQDDDGLCRLHINTEANEA